MIRHQFDDLWVVTMFQDGPAGAMLPVKPPAAQRALNMARATVCEGEWHRADVEVQVQVHHYMLARRSNHVMRTDDIIGLMPGLPRPMNTEMRVVISPTVPR